MKMTVLATSVISFFSLGCSIFGYQSEETPRYEVLLKQEPFEIRKYQPYLAAQTEVEGDFKEAQNKAFRILAKYIFGENVSQKKIAMTAPVVHEPRSEKIAMTAPVTQAEIQGKWVMTFMMPSEYTKVNLPQPKDERIKIVEVQEKWMAVRSYSGLWSKKKNDKLGEELKDWMALRNEWEAVGVVQFAGYNPPWTLPFLRKNEALIELKPKSGF
jgi:hypothetical protein